MNQETFEIMRGMDQRAAETQLVLQCAPLIVGLKVSNLLIVPNENVSRIKELLRSTQIAYYILYAGERKTAILLYHAGPLGRYLAQHGVRRMLWHFGYDTGDMATDDLLGIFAARYGSYMEGHAKFPHEMGLFLGYPPEDVAGFIDNAGKNYLCAGYWKVYDDVAAKRELFRRFDQATEYLIHLAADGASIPAMLSTGYLPGAHKMKQAGAY